MGLCLSRPVEPAVVAENKYVVKARLEDQDAAASDLLPVLVVAGDISTASMSSASAGSAAAAKHAPPRRSLFEPSVRLDLISKVHEMQQALALIDCHALLALPEAAELLAEHMQLDLVGICAFDEDDSACAALLASHGPSAAVLERRVIMHGPDWAAACLRGGAAAGGGGGGGRLLVPDAQEAPHLPADFAALYKEHGLRTLAAVAIGAPGGEPLGALIVGRREPGGFGEASGSLWLSAAATALLQHMRPAQLAPAVRMLRSIEEAEDPVGAISALLQAGAAFMWRTTNIRMGVRLALVEPGTANALVFESARAAKHAAGGDACGAGGGGGSAAVSTAAAALAPPDDVTVTQLDMANTLLQSAVTNRAARFVQDCVAYLQNNPSPARDAFSCGAAPGAAPVSSVVVVPLMGADGVAVGALYFTQSAPCDFGNIQDVLLGFVHCVTLSLHQRLVGQTEALKAMALQAPDPSELLQAAATGRSPSPPLPLQRAGTGPDSGQLSPQSPTSWSPRARAGAGGPGGASPPPSAPISRMTSMTSTSRLFRAGSSKRLCTDAMVSALQQEIRKRGSRSLEMTDLVLSEEIGRGGFGKVFRGTWHRRPAAIKVMHARSTASEAVSDAMEMAVLSSVQHPNIVQVYACLTDMVELPRSAASSNNLAANAGGLPPAGPPRRPRYRRMQPGEECEDAKNVIVMEHCDRGTLSEAVRRPGTFHVTLPDGSIGVSLPAVVDVLIDVAHSLEYLHGLGLVHGDIKLDNVLLKSDASRPLGFVPKLADFGLARLLRDSHDVINLTGAGTVTHLAPELLQAGTKITAAVDTYAFGICLYEIYAGKRCYAGLQRETIIQRVLRHALRPVFPPAAPTAYVQLAEACWSTAPSDRPTMSEVVARLRQIADALARYEGDGGGAGGRSLVAEAAAAVIEAAKWSVAGAAAAELEE